MSLPEYLSTAGFRQVPLERNGVGHFEAAGTLDGHPVRLLIDTGAASTVVSLSLARELGLEVVPLGRFGGGAGGAQLEVFQLPGAELKLTGVVPKPKALFAMDLSHVNTALQLKGATPVDGVLGVDVFDRQSAVIDYGSSSLFLKEA
jgi:hypothetical protein